VDDSEGRNSPALKGPEVSPGRLPRNGTARDRVHCTLIAAPALPTPPRPSAPVLSRDQENAGPDPGLDPIGIAYHVQVWFIGFFPEITGEGHAH
jgi:hypothetical protein